jgi:biotin carboxyl carrier protein
VSRLPDGAMNVEIGDFSIQCTIRDPKRLQTGLKTSGHTVGKGRLVAPMPGKVVRVLAPVGTTVSRGDGVLVVEAMKMQNEVKAIRDGIVSSINVNPGSTVNAGDVLAVIE